MQHQEPGRSLVVDFLTGGGFPAFGLSLLLCYELLLLALVLTPGAETGLGAFADEFRTWCLGYDPTTGRIAWSYTSAMFGPPLMLAAILALLWWDPLRSLARRPAALAAPVLAGALLVGGAAGALAALAGPDGTGDLAFPAEALRTSHRPPELRLTNQAGETVDLGELRGHVVVLSGIYASCPHTCPLILDQAKRTIGRLTSEERRELRVVAVTLDPEHDSPEVLASLAQHQGLELPLFNLVTGQPADVERVLDEMGIARERSPETGVINHTNLFLVLDRAGRVAYRFALGDRQERWLEEALQLLLDERPDAG
jgi:protein SCO1/2